MLIGIDGNEANVRQRVGVNVWAAELLKALHRLTKKAKKGQSLQGLSFLTYLSRLPLADLPKENARWQYRVIPPGKLWTRWRLPLDLYLRRPRPEVFLSLSHYAPKWAPMPRVVSIMDLSFLEFPKAFKPLVLRQLRSWTEESVKKSAQVIAISKFTKDEIIKHYGYPEGKITVVYPGISKKFQEFTNTRGQSLQGQTLLEKRYGIEGKYLLFVGTQQPKKNLKRLFKAFELVLKDYPDLQLVVAGKVWHQFRSQKTINNEPRTMKRKSVKCLGYVSKTDLPPLMAGAEIFVMPSLYEGFGIPVVEAMSLGTPVAVSNTTSLPEVVGKVGVLFDPTDVVDISGAINRILSMPAADKKKMVKKGIIRAREFSWEEAAKKVLQILMEVCDTSIRKYRKLNR